MASCQTSRWVDTAPYVTLTVNVSSQTETAATLSYTLTYTADYPASTSNAKNYTVSINGSTVASGTYSIDGKTGTYTIKSGTVSITKGTSAKSISFSTSFGFNLTWSGVYKGTLSASGSITVKAKNSYTIKYNANGGSGAPSNQTKWYGETLKLSTTKPTRTGYSFQVWNTSSSGSGDIYPSGNNYTHNESATLYAIWSTNSYKVTYNANGGSGAPSAQYKTHDVTLTLSSTKPTRTGYTFLGWGTSASSTSATYSAGGSYTKNSAITLYAVWRLAYTKPKISGFRVSRCNSSGTVSDEGTYALIKFNWSTTYHISSISYTCKSSSTTIEDDITSEVSADGSSGSVNYVIGNGQINTEKSWTLTVTVADGSGSSYITRSIGSIKLAMDIRTGATGVAFGKTAELSGVADFGYSTRHRSPMVFENGLDIRGLTADGTAWKEMATPLDSSGNMRFGYGNYNAKDGTTYLYGHDLMFGVSNLASPGTYRPYARKGDTISVRLRTAGYVTNSGTEVSFFMSLTRPVIGSPTITASSSSGFILRQGATYTHGSAANTYVTPTKYSVSSYYAYGLLITATFSDTTNVTNNDAIGIYWSGVITFS